MMTGLLALAALTAPAGAAGAAPIEGRWVSHLSCKGATGMYADRCAQGERDLFELDLALKGGRICGGYMLTFQMGNHEEDGDLSDWLFKPSGPGLYDVRFHISGSTGKSTVRLTGSRLIWHRVSERMDPLPPDLEWVFPPQDVVLTRLPDDPKAGPITCDG